MFEVKAEAEAKILASRPLWPRGLNISDKRWITNKRPILVATQSCQSTSHTPLAPVRSLPGRRSLRSIGTNCLLVPPVKRSTVGSRAFPVAGPETWNALPEDVGKWLGKKLGFLNVY